MTSLTDISEVRACSVVPTWFIRVELGPEDTDTIRHALSATLELRQGSYCCVAYESRDGTQFFRPLDGSVMGKSDLVETRPVRVLSVTIPREKDALEKALHLIFKYHSYEEPVVTVLPSFSAHAALDANRDEEARWWNQ